MRRIDSHTIGVAQGDTILFSDFEHDGEMWSGSGPRMRQKTIEFDSPFKTPPAVHCNLSMWDIDKATNMRADISAEGITTTGFTVVFRTWGATRVARVRIAWMAIGALHNDDDWDIA